MLPSQSKAEAEMDPRRMIQIAAGFVRTRSPAGRAIVVTNDAAAFAGYDDLTVEQWETADAALIAYERTRCYRDYIAARVGRADLAGAIFLDTDALALREMAAVFDHPFDVALTYVEGSVQPPAPPVDHWGLPTDGRLSAINFGVMAVRFTPAAVGFFNAVLERYDAIIAEGDRFLGMARNRFRTADKASDGFFQIPDVRVWGGAQFSVTSLLSEHLFGRFREDCEVAGARIRLLPSELWNYSPPGGRMTMEMLDGRYVLHLKGSRKAQFSAVAAWLA